MTTRGSSPLARGLLEQLEQVQTLDRIIPARAGFTRRSRTLRWPCGDHPRSRGVYPYTISSRSAIWGSSPLARGLPGARGGGGTGHRIIPARAGFTHGVAPWDDYAEDHPRSRGVY